MADGIYLIPIELDSNNIGRGPKYLPWRFHPGDVATNWAGMDYGFLPTMLVVIRDVAAGVDTFLQAQGDVYTFPTNLDAAVDDAGIDAFLEPLGIPTDWLTPSTEWRELLRRLAGMFQFNQRYGRISGGGSLLEGRTLDARWNSLSAQEQAWVEQTAAEFGWAGGIQGNPSLRILVKRASDEWGVEPFVVGGVTI